MKVEMTKLFSTVHKEARPPQKEVVVTKLQTIRTPPAIASRISVHRSSRPLVKQVKVRSEQVSLAPTTGQVVAPLVKRRFHKVASLLHKTPAENRKPISDREKRLLFVNTNMTLTGILEEGEEGLYYLRIAPSLFENLVSHFSMYPLDDAPFNPDMGPSIPVILPSERPFGIIPVGESFTFQVSDVFIQEHHDWPGVTSSLSITVDIPEIKKLRDKCGLCASPLMKPFTLVLGVVTAKGIQKERGYYQVNVSESFV